MAKLMETKLIKLLENKIVFWGAFFVFAICAIAFSSNDKLFTINGPLSAGKYVVWGVFLAFLTYSIYCSFKESLFKSLAEILQLHWGRQVGMDLYLGASLILFIIYLNEGSLLVVALWILPIFSFINLATLLYFAIHFDSIVGKFLS